MSYLLRKITDDVSYLHYFQLNSFSEKNNGKCYIFDMFYSFIILCMRCVMTDVGKALREFSFQCLWYSIYITRFECCILLCPLAELFLMFISTILMSDEENSSLDYDYSSRCELINKNIISEFLFPLLCHK